MRSNTGSSRTCSHSGTLCHGSIFGGAGEHNARPPLWPSCMGKRSSASVQMTGWPSLKWFVSSSPSKTPPIYSASTWQPGASHPPISRTGQDTDFRIVIRPWGDSYTLMGPDFAREVGISFRLHLLHKNGLYVWPIALCNAELKWKCAEKCSLQVSRYG